MKKLYVIAGCNGAGKTTASYSVLPELLGCEQFVNADEIAKGLSPFNPEKAAIQAGRIMLDRIKSLINNNETFAFETTLSTKSHANIIKTAQASGYEVSLLFFWLNHEDLAKKRVEIRVKEGGHNIPPDVISRRYKRGLWNFFCIFIDIVDDWMFVNNSGMDYEIIAEGAKSDINIMNPILWNDIKRNCDEK